MRITYLLIKSGGALIWGIGIIIVLAVVANAYTTTKNHDEIRAQYNTAIKDGANIVSVTNQSQTISASTCEQLNQESDIKHAGGITRNTPIKASTAPGVPLQSGIVTPNYINVFKTNPIKEEQQTTSEVSSSVIFGSIAARESGITAGAKVNLESIGLVTVAEVLETNHRTGLIDRWIFLPQAPVGTVAECWIETKEHSRQAVMERLNSVFAASYPIQISPMLDDDPNDSIEKSLLALSTNLPWIIAGTASGLIVLLMRLGRDKIALLHLSGCSRLQVGIVLPFCVLAQGVVGLGVAALALEIRNLISDHPYLTVDTQAGLATGALTVSIVTVITVGYVMLPSRNVLTLLKG